LGRAWAKEAFNVLLTPHLNGEGGLCWTIYLLRCRPFYVKNDAGPRLRLGQEDPGVQLAGAVIDVSTFGRGDGLRLAR
jgi:hypothetical protein